MKSLLLALIFACGTPAFAKDTHGAQAHETGVSADQAQKWLVNGNRRFTSNRFRADGRSMTDVKRLATGQKPHSIILSCSDSRVPPEHIFDQSLGEIFVIRVAGQALDTSVIASIEYAVEHLGTKNIVVLGHTHCGAVKAALATKAGESAGSASLDALIADIKPRLHKISTEQDVAGESGDNAKGVADDLLKKSKILSEKVENHEIKVRAALYYLKDGQIVWF